MYFLFALAYLGASRWGGINSFYSHPSILFSIDAVVASAYSLFIVGVTSFVGAIPKYKDHLVSVKAGLFSVFRPLSAYL